VDSCTALVEEHTGALRLVRWPVAPIESAWLDATFGEEKSCAR
jgi:hypothetical protein